MQSVSHAQAAAATSVTLAATSSHRPETVGGGSDCAPSGGRARLHACSKAEEESGFTGLDEFFLCGMRAMNCPESRAISSSLC